MTRIHDIHMPRRKISGFELVGLRVGRGQDETCRSDGEHHQHSGKEIEDHAFKLFELCGLP